MVKERYLYVNTQKLVGTWLSPGKSLMVCLW